MGLSSFIHTIPVKLADDKNVDEFSELKVQCVTKFSQTLIEQYFGYCYFQKAF